MLIKWIQVEEFDSPENLMKNSDGEFRRLIDSMDEVERAKIFQKAKEIEK